MNKNKNAAAAIILLIVILVAAKRNQEEQKPTQSTSQPFATGTQWRDPQQTDSEYWSAFHEGMDIEFRKDRGSREWWSAWEKNFDRRMDAKMRR